MDTVKLRTDIEHATECLYQNRGQDGLEAVRNLLPQFQEMIQVIYAGADSARALEFLEVLKTLIENYQAQDMLGMADFYFPIIEQVLDDCLKGSTEEMILCLGAEENQSPEK